MKICFCEGVLVTLTARLEGLGENWEMVAAPYLPLYVCVAQVPLLSNRTSSMVSAVVEGVEVVNGVAVRFLGANLGGNINFVTIGLYEYNRVNVTLGLEGLGANWEIVGAP